MSSSGNPIQEVPPLSELVYEAGKLKFIKWDKNTWQDDPAKTPPGWLQSFAKKNVIQLASCPAPFISFDGLAIEIRRHIHQYFDCPQTFESVAVLYVVMTWLTELFEAVPYLRFLGIAGTGKTRGSEIIGGLCYKSLCMAGSATPASLYHLIENIGGTLLIDEADFADTNIGSEIAKILNSGYTRGKQVVRMEINTATRRWEPRAYEVFGPKILNGRMRFSDDATESRCLTFISRETDRTDIPVQLTSTYRAEAQALRNTLLGFRSKYLGRINFENRHIDGISRRTNQIVLPLLLVAEQLADRAFYDDLLEFARGVDTQTRQDRRDTLDAALVGAYVTLSSRTGPEPTCREIKGEIMREVGPNEPEVRNLSDRRVGSMATTLGFTKSHTNRGTVLRIDNKGLEALRERFCIGTRSSPNPSPYRDDHDGNVTEKTAA